MPWSFLIPQRARIRNELRSPCTAVTRRMRTGSPHVAVRPTARPQQSSGAAPSSNAAAQKKKVLPLQEEQEMSPESRSLQQQQQKSPLAEQRQRTEEEDKEKEEGPLRDAEEKDEEEKLEREGSVVASEPEAEVGALETHTATGAGFCKNSWCNSGAHLIKSNGYCVNCSLKFKPQVERSLSGTESAGGASGGVSGDD